MGVVYIEYHSVIVDLGIYDWMCQLSIIHSVDHFVILIQYFHFVAISCCGILIGCIFNFSIAHSLYRSLLMFWYFLFAVSRLLHIMPQKWPIYVLKHVYYQY